MRQWDSTFYGFINELRHKDEGEIRSILKARVDLNDSFDYMLILVRNMCAEWKQELVKVKASNPDLEEDFVKKNLLSEGYPKLIEILEDLSADCLLEKEKTYWLKAEKEFGLMKDKFLKQLRKSSAKQLLLGNEIKKYEDLLLRNKDNPGFFQAQNDRVKYGDEYFRVDYVTRYRSLYEKLIIKGDRDFRVTRIFDLGIGGSAKDTFHIKVEAMSKYLEWLKLGFPLPDTRFRIKKETLLKDSDYGTIANQINDYGGYIVHSGDMKAMIYTPELAIILSSEKLKVRNLDSKEEESISGFDFLDSYLKGFREGVEHFKKVYATPPDTLYGKSGDKYVNDLHHNVFHIPAFSGKEGWIFVKKTFPAVISHRNIKEYGFYSGLLSEVEVLRSKFPSVFEDFEKRCMQKVVKKEAKIRAECLLDIWLPDKQGQKTSYRKYIEFLKKENLTIGTSFIKDIQGELYWNKNPLRGWVQYLAGFTYTCIQKKWIADAHSAPVLARALAKTFNVQFDHAPFKQLAANPPKENFLTPFKNLPANV
jgi:hypothetical protein